MPPCALPNPLALTGDQFVARCKADLAIHRPMALAAYRAAFRQGRRDAHPALVTLPEMPRVLREESPEGEVIKFLLRLDPAAASQGFNVPAQPVL